LGLSSTHALPLFCHAPQSPLELAEPVFGSLRGCTLHDRTAHQCFLQRDALQDFAGILKTYGLRRDPQESEYATRYFGISDCRDLLTVTPWPCAAVGR
jgi:hypothetical protein